MSGTMSTDTATLIAAGAGVFGVLAGVVVDRLLRFWGRPWCEPTDYSIIPRSGNNYEGIKTETDPEATEWIHYSVRLDLYNSKEVPVGLRDIRMVFKCLGGEIADAPKDMATGELEQRHHTLPDRLVHDHIYVINIPPRQWVVKELFGRFDDPEDIRLVFEWRQLEFVSEQRRVWPLRPKTFRKLIASRPPYSDPFARAGSGSVPREARGIDPHS
jgi:hypothetical protein